MQGDLLLGPYWGRIGALLGPSQGRSDRVPASPGEGREDIGSYWGLIVVLLVVLGGYWGLFGVCLGVSWGC